MSGVWWWTFGNVPELPGHEINQLVETKADDIQILDVRTSMEFKNGHIKGARNCGLFPTWSFRSRMRQMGLDKDKPVFCICLSAHRSIAAQKLLTEEGFKHAKQLQGGMKAWRKAKLPEEREHVDAGSTDSADNNKPPDKS